MHKPVAQPDTVAQLEGLLRRCAQEAASDLHLSVGMPPVLRVHGKLQPLESEPLEGDDIRRLADVLLHDRQQQVFEERRTLDAAYSLPEGIRYRANLFQQRGHLAIALRRLDDKFRTLAELHLPEQLGEFADLRDGLVLVTGPTGSGKSTTLATLINQINHTRACHVLTVEDPIEYVHQNRQSLIHQRELHTDVPSFAEAVRSALREDPDVILVGEMRDLETMRAAITAAETGHLVYSTLHTGDAVGAIDRMIGVFPGPEQDSIRQQLSMVLKGVIAQRLLPNAAGTGRVPAVEILRVTPAVAHLIRSAKAQQVYSSIESGSALGMQTLEQSLADLAQQGLVTPEAARSIARDPRIFDERLRMGAAALRR